MTRDKRKGIMKKARRTILKTLTVLVLTLLTAMACLYPFLKFVDPLGIHAYSQWIHWTQANRLPHASGFVHPTGTYTIAGSTLTIGDDGLRVVPETNTDADCTVALIGDSVAFGFGVSDDETFAYHLTQALPNVHIINASRQGYDGNNLIWAVETVEADIYIYVMVVNDSQPATGIYPMPPLPNVLSQHIAYFVARSRHAPTYDYENFEAVMDTMQSVDALVFDATGGSPLVAVAETYTDVIPLDRTPPEYRISYADSHPSALGHQAIAETILPYLDTEYQQHCR